MNFSAAVRLKRDLADQHRSERACENDVFGSVNNFRHPGKTRFRMMKKHWIIEPVRTLTILARRWRPGYDKGVHVIVIFRAPEDFALAQGASDLSALFTGPTSFAWARSRQPENRHGRQTRK
ncbi:hypothetical protein [Mesorhizobium erdmanii]|uniref:hypothetical protein n=1 Tax=Mesorhizobium erdmanii TaxID=1777866 RepID=UPI0012DB367E|nr:MULTISPECIES: hypothetical protein [Mesorhizobium]